MGFIHHINHGSSGEKENSRTCHSETANSSEKHASLHTYSAHFSLRYATQTDMTSGPIFKQLLTFTLPILLSQLLQQFYNIADTAMVGRLVGADALGCHRHRRTITVGYREFLYRPLRRNQRTHFPSFRKTGLYEFKDMRPHSYGVQRISWCPVHSDRACRSALVSEMAVHSGGYHFPGNNLSPNLSLWNVGSAAIQCEHRHPPRAGKHGLCAVLSYFFISL